MTSPTGRFGVSATWFGPPGAVLHTASMPVQVERDDQRARAIGRGQRRGFPAAGGQPQRRVLQLGFGRGQPDRQLAQHLGVRVQRVAGRAPVVDEAAGQAETMAGEAIGA